MSTKSQTLTLIAVAALVAAGCGNVHEGSSASQVTITQLQGAQGATLKFGTNLASDVITSVKVNNVLVPTIFNDPGQVTMAMALKNQGLTTTIAPTALNTVVFSHYRVEYRRTDGHNIEGVDVPYSFSSGLTFSVSDQGGSAGFQLVRNSAKEEAPLKALATNGQFISTIATVTFYGVDVNGHNVTVSGTIGVDFGDFADPT